MKKKTVKANMQHATQQGESSTTSPKRLLWAVNEDSLRQSEASTSPKRLHWAVNGDSTSHKRQQVRRDFTGQSMNSASQQRQQVRRDFTGQSIETPPVRAGKARTAKRKRNMDKHRKDNKAQESR
jgi:hypothetical protein